MVDICQEGRSQRSAPQNRHKAHRTRRAWKLRIGRGWEKSRCTWGDCVCQAPGSLSCSDRGRHKTQAQPRLRLCGVPENTNLSGLGHLGKCMQLRARSLSCSAWSLSSVDGESTYAVSGGKPSVAGTLRALPTHASDTCLQRPSLPTGLNKRT